ncbi:hypothetical protein [Lacipirellula parvula]|uniref:Uncharacterized protein n=1 Tax=Lacipirellula parvula TaxID=2650471 RepID=A0A5K7X894_9BACT|nr:hypothetical protein [Lacipirellula parvula]BBO32092.1 hypothetical protein PLANPX_1704 [Lacipirellula parvula]
MKRWTTLLSLYGMLLIAPGCQEQKPADPPADATAMAEALSPAKDDSHGHSHGSGPHDGAVADWGGGAYHVEFTVDHDAKQATVYILGSDGKSAAPIKAETINLIIDEPATELTLKAEPLEGETDGMSSRFSGTHDTIGIVREFSGTIRGEVDGTPYVGEFAEVAHGH